MNHPGGIFDGGIGPPCSIKIAETGSKTFTVQLPNLRRRRSILFSDELLTGPACLMRGSHLPGAFHRVFFSVFPMFFFLSVFVKPFFFLQALATKCTTPAQCLLCQKVGNLPFCRVQQVEKLCNLLTSKLRKEDFSDR